MQGYGSYEGCLDLLGDVVQQAKYDYAESVELGAKDLQVRGFLMCFLDSPGHRLVINIETLPCVRRKIIRDWRVRNYRRRTGDKNNQFKPNLRSACRT